MESVLGNIGNAIEEQMKESEQDEEGGGYFSCSESGR